MKKEILRQAQNDSCRKALRQEDVRWIIDKCKYKNNFNILNKKNDYS